MHRGRPVHSKTTSAPSGARALTEAATSSAAPLVAGAVAVILDANPYLGWRDVQHVLVHSAEKNDPGDSSWIVNGAGRDVSVKYGFGRIDLGAAVTLAQSWPNVAPEVSYETSVMTVNTTIPDGTGDWDAWYIAWYNNTQPYPQPVPGTPGQLYDLEDDPQEQNDLWDENPEVVQRLARLLDDYKTRGHSRF